MEGGGGEGGKSLAMEDKDHGRQEVEEVEGEEGEEEEGMQLSCNGRGEDMSSLPVGIMEGEGTPDLQNQFDGFLSGSQPVAQTGGGSGDSISMETDGSEISEGGGRGSGRGKPVARSKGRKGSGVSKPKE